MKLGDKIKVRNALKRNIETYLTSAPAKYWDVVRTEEQEAVFLGFRTLTNGFREWYAEEGYRFHRGNHFKAALVCSNENRNPFYVLLDDSDIEYEYHPAYRRGRFDTRKLGKAA